MPYKPVIRPLESQLIPLQPSQGLESFAHRAALSPVVFPVARYKSMSAQNCSAAPTSVESPLTSGVLKSFVAVLRTGVQSEHGKLSGAVGAEVVNCFRHAVNDCEVEVADGADDEALDEGEPDVLLEDDASEGVELEPDDLVRREVQRPMVSAARQRMINAIKYCFDEL